MGAPAGASQSPASPHPRPRSAKPSQASDQVVRAMTEMLARQHPASTAEALRALRRGYPEIPLALRIAALRTGTGRK